MTGLARFPKCASYLRAVDKKALTDPGCANCSGGSVVRMIKAEAMG